MARVAMLRGLFCFTPDQNKEKELTQSTQR
jgi:hypothetical protein